MGNVRDWDYDVQALLGSKKAKAVIKYIADGNCACPLASQWLNNVLLTPEHMLNVFKYLLIKFPFSQFHKPYSDGSRIVPETIVQSKAGKLSKPRKLTDDDLNTDEKDFTEAKSVEIDKPFRVISKTDISEKSYVLRIDRHGLDFIPGQYFIIGRKESDTAREYTVYSSKNDDYLEFMITRIKDGIVSNDLANCKPGEELQVEGPLGYFELETNPDFRGKHVFIATGSGIAPFRSIVLSNPDLNYEIIHGARLLQDCYHKEDYSEDRYISCITREESGDFKGRVTDYLKQNPVDPEDMFYICGNTEMLYEVYDILISQGVVRESVRVEVFY